MLLHFRSVQLLAHQGLTLYGDSVVTATRETVDGNTHTSSEPDSNVYQLLEFRHSIPEQAVPFWSRHSTPGVTCPLDIYSKVQHLGGQCTPE